MLRGTRNCEAIGEPPIVGVLRVLGVSRAFDAGRTVEVKFATAYPAHDFVGEVYMRVPAERADTFKIGDEYAVKLERWQ